MAVVLNAAGATTLFFQRAAAGRNNSAASSSGHDLQRTAFLKSRGADALHPTWGYGRVFCTPELLRMVQMPSKGLYATVDSGKITSSDNAEDFDFPPPGCTRVKVELNKPLGIILEEDKAGNIFVAEVVKEGNADKSGLVDVGDQLIATSAIVYGYEDFYQGVKVRKGMQIVRLSVFGEKFETVMAAIGTHPAHVKVALEIQKCQKSSIRGENNGAATSQ